MRESEKERSDGSGENAKIIHPALTHRRAPPRSLAPMPFSLFLALRYLKPKRTFVSVITVMSIVGVALGVAALVVVIAVMSGFEKQIKESLIGFEPHIIVSPTEEVADLPEDERVNWRKVKEVTSALPYITNAAPFVEADVLYTLSNDKGGSSSTPGRLYAIDENDAPTLAKYAKLLKEGSFDLTNDRVVINEDVANRLGLHVGDTLEVISSTVAQKALRRLDEWDKMSDEEKDQQTKTLMDELAESVTPLSLTVSGIFSSLQHPSYVFAPLHIGKELKELGDGADGLALDTIDAYRAEEFTNRLIDEGAVPMFWAVQPWMVKWERWFATIRNERMMMYLVLFVIVLVAAFSIMNTLITVTVQKRREIGIINALGARVGQIISLFLTQGMIVGVLGVLAGNALGWFILVNRNTIKTLWGKLFGQELFPKEFYFLAEIPANLRWQDVTIISVGAFVLCTLAALPPAWMAARLDPGKALRSE